MAELELCKNRIWMVVVQIDPVSQLIPSNVGFNIIYKTHISLCQDAVLYLPTFDVPATEIARAL